MKIERLRKSHKKEIIKGGLILISIVSAITLVTTKAKYKAIQDIKLAKGTVNYKVPDVRTVAVYLNDGNGDVETNNIPISGYNLNSEKSVCKVYDGTTSIENAPKDNNISIEYKEGKINILGVSKKNTRCYLYFDKKTEILASTVVANIASIAKTGTPNFANVATTDEGIFKVEDGMYGGYSYYWRGAVTNNYVKFANKCWRIIRINGDGSIRLIYDGTTCHANGESTTDNIAIKQAYNSNYGRSEYVGWTYSTAQRPSTDNPQTSGTASNAKTQLESWYNTNLADYDSKIAYGKFCNDRNTASGSTWNSTGETFYYAGFKRLDKDYQPTLSCSNGDIYSLKVGLITADEVMYAGGTNADNTSYYLYNGQNYWTMSPREWDSNAWMFNVHNSGYLYYASVYNTYGLRLVINLKADTIFAAGGNGTQSNPYVVS